MKELWLSVEELVKVLESLVKTVCRQRIKKVNSEFFLRRFACDINMNVPEKLAVEAGKQHLDHVNDEHQQSDPNVNENIVAPNDC